MASYSENIGASLFLSFWCLCPINKMQTVLPKGTTTYINMKCRLVAMQLLIYLCFASFFGALYLEHLLSY